MAYENFFRIKDYNTSPLWSGTEIYILAENGLSISGTNTVMSKPKTFADITLNSTDTGLGDSSTNYKNNFNRRKSNVSYSGFENQKIPIVAIYKQEIGSQLNIQGTIQQLFTPHKLYELVLKPRTVYIKDQFLIESLTTAEGTSPAIYSTKGIPVILESWAISTSIEGKEVYMTLTFQEDKGV